MRSIAAVAVSLLLLCSILPHSAPSNPRIPRTLQETGNAGVDTSGGNSTGALSPTDTPAGSTAEAPAPDAAEEEEPCSIEWYQAHGWLMWAGFGVLMPVGIIVSRHLQAVTKAWFHVHIGCMTVGMACVLAGGIIGLVKFEAIPGTPQDDPAAVHVYFGLAVLIMAVVNFTLGLIRPHKGNVPRVVWYASHFTFGTCVVAFAWYIIFTGMDVYEETWAVDLQVEQTLFAIQVAVFGYAYLFLGRWDYLISQKDKEPQIDGIKRFTSTWHVGSSTNMHEES